MAAREESLELRIQRWPFVQVPSALLVSDASDGAKLTYATLQLWAGIDGRAFPNRQRLADARGVDRATLYRHLTELEGRGWVGRITETAGPNQIRHVIKVMHTPVGSTSVAPMQPEGSQPRDGEGRTTATQKETPERHSGKRLPSSSAKADGGNGTRPSPEKKKAKPKPRGTWAPNATERSAFDRWWPQVPRKVGKDQALVTFVKCSRGCGGISQTLELPDEETLFQATRAWAQNSIDRGEVRFCKHPSSWLNSGGWEDDDAFAEVDTGPTPAQVEAKKVQQAEDERRRYIKQMERAGMKLDPDTLEVVDWGPSGPPGLG